MGPLGVIKYLKVAQLVVVQYHAGNNCTSTWSLGFPVALRGSLPKLLPPITRRAIRSEQDKKVLRFVITLLGAYRAFLAPVKWSSDLLASIREGPTYQYARLAHWDMFVSVFLRDVGVQPLRFHHKMKNFSSVKSSASGVEQNISKLRDLSNWLKLGHYDLLFKAVEEFFGSEGIRYLEKHVALLRER